jgi:hypothetical protein
LFLFDDHEYTQTFQLKYIRLKKSKIIFLAWSVKIHPSPYMLILNHKYVCICRTEDKLTNGSRGEVLSIHVDNVSKIVVDYVILQMDEADAGIMEQQKHP